MSFETSSLTSVNLLFTNMCPSHNHKKYMFAYARLYVISNFLEDLRFTCSFLILNRYMHLSVAFSHTLFCVGVHASPSISTLNALPIGCPSSEPQGILPSSISKLLSCITTSFQLHLQYLIVVSASSSLKSDTFCHS